MRIKDKQPARKSQHIPSDHMATLDLDTIHFSFKYLDLTNTHFSINQRTSKYFEKIIARLKELCTLKAKEIYANRSRALRAHPIQWKETTQPKGFIHLNEQLQQIPPYQFQISTNEHGRVHGFFISNIFFIVWFDPDHKLYL